MSDGLVVLYGLVGRDHPVQVSAPVTSHPIRRCDLEDVAAVFRSHPAGQPLGPRDLLDHTAVLDSLLQDGPVLPCRFGTTAPNESAIRDAWLPHARWYAGELQRLDRHVEMAVTAKYIEPGVVERLVDDHPELLAYKERAHPHDIPAQMRIGEAVAEAMQQRGIIEGRDVRSELAAAAADVVERERPFGAVERAAYLVHADRVEEFMARVDALRDQRRRWLDVECIGPLPPYSFVRTPEHAAAGGSTWAS